MSNGNFKDRVSLIIEDGIACVRLTRPDKINALDIAMLDAIVGAIEEVSSRNDIRCVVLSGEGRGFCAGIDLGVLSDGSAMSDLETRTHGQANRFQQIAWGWRTCPVPVIAAVHGIAFGGGCQLMLGADMRIAAPDADISLMEVRWGLVPDVAGMALLKGLVRGDHLRDLIFTGRRVNGHEAEALGLVTKVADDPLATAMEIARGIAASSPDAIRAGKRLINASVDMSDAEILMAEAVEQQLLLASFNHKEAINAAREKREPRYKDPG